MKILKRLFKKNYTKEQNQFFDLMHSGGLFSEFTEEELMHLWPHVHKREFEESEVVFFASDPSRALYILMSGEVKLYIEYRSRFEELVRVDEGHVFGDSAVIDHQLRRYTAIVTSQKAEILVIPSLAIMDLYRDSPKVKAKLFFALSKQYSDYLNRIFDAYLRDSVFFEIKRINETR